ncbi:MAG: hypothetical protein J6I85_01675, partial [Clostridia bacterium]|nr:hypothetical protein [Clostridia bacterium]
TGGIGVYVYDSANFKMTGGNINAISSSNVYGIETITFTNKPIVVIEGGTITATATNTNGVAYGIYMADGNNWGRNQSVTIGKKDKIVNKNSPIITGTTYGIYNYVQKELNFYDGTIRGKTLPVGGNITKVEDKYTVNSEAQDEYQTYYLALLSTDMVSAFVNGRYYETLQLAIDACADNTETYVIMANGCVLDSDIEIGANKNIVLDLNGYSITSNSSYSIVNNGKLTIIDSSEEKTGSISYDIITGSGTVINQLN